MLQFERQVIEAERDVNRAVNENNLSVNLFTQFGYTQSAGTLEDAYTNLEDQQLVNLGIQIPILDWGRGKASIEMAKANRDLVMSNLSQQKINFQQEVLSAVQNFNIQSKQYRIATRADSVAQKRYDITKQRFYIGKIDITDLNLALSEKDRARQAAVQALRQYWISFYRVRELTLYDFEQKLEISVQEGELL